MYLIYYLILIVASVILIQGTRKHKHRKLVLFMVLMAIGIVMSFIQMFTAGLAGLPFAIVAAVFSVYFFICVYSLYDEMKTRKHVGALGSVYVYSDQTQSYVHPGAAIVRTHQPNRVYQQPEINVQSTYLESATSSAPN